MVDDSTFPPEPPGKKAKPPGHPPPHLNLAPSESKATVRITPARVKATASGARPSSAPAAGETEETEEIVVEQKEEIEEKSDNQLAEPQSLQDAVAQMLAQCEDDSVISEILDEKMVATDTRLLLARSLHWRHHRKSESVSLDDQDDYLW